MKRLVYATLTSLFCLAPQSLAGAGADPMLYIQVRSTKLRAKPEFWSAALADLSYGSALTPLGAAPTDKSWLKVKLDATEGYVHVSSVTKRKIILKASADTNGKNVDQSSIVLAGKGFNSQIENNYRSAKGLDYSAVDEVEKLGVDPGEEGQFVSDGKLTS